MDAFNNSQSQYCFLNCKGYRSVKKEFNCTKSLLVILLLSTESNLRKKIFDRSASFARFRRGVFTQL